MVPKLFEISVFFTSEVDSKSPIAPHNFFNPWSRSILIFVLDSSTCGQLLCVRFQNSQIFRTPKILQQFSKFQLHKKFKSQQELSLDHLPLAFLLSYWVQERQCRSGFSCTVSSCNGGAEEAPPPVLSGCGTILICFNFFVWYWRRAGGSLHPCETSTRGSTGLSSAKPEVVSVPFNTSFLLQV